MKILIVSDIHGGKENASMVVKIARDIDGIIVCGDITHFGRKAQAEPVMHALMEGGAPVCGIHGNCDKPEVLAYLEDEGLSAHAGCCSLEGLSILGIGGSLPAPIDTPSVYTEEEGAELLEKMAGIIPEVPWVFVSHQPPVNSSADRIRSGLNVGSHAVADFIRKHKPPLVCTGHIHEARSVSTFAESLLVNPGSLAEGHYALAEFDGQNVQAELLNL